MKKMLSLLISAFMIAAGLVAFSGSAANAACPYTGCVATNTKIDDIQNVKRKQRAKICVRVGTNGNGRPDGKVKITVRRAKGGFKWQDIKKYNDARECFKTPRLRKRGNYVVKAKFDKKPGSGYQDSDRIAEFRVKRR